MVYILCKRYLDLLVSNRPLLYMLQGLRPSFALGSCQKTRYDEAVKKKEAYCE